MIKKLHFTHGLAIAAIAIFMFLPGLGWGQSPTNGGFENATNATNGTDWTNIGSGTFTVGATSARTGVNALAYTTTSNNSQNINSVSTISVANNAWFHIIGWAKGNNTSSRASVGTVMGTVNTSTNIATIGTTLTRLTFNAQNVDGSTQTALAKFNSRSTTNLTSTTLYWDDIITYTDALTLPDLTKPTAASVFTNGSITASSITFTWTAGTDVVAPDR